MSAHVTNDDLQFHAWCLMQTGTRLDQFAKAMASRITPGDAVVDLGAGSGILTFLACMAGARRVYAIEAGESLSFARLLATDRTFHDRIEFINTRSTQVTLPERVDAIVGDIHDTFGLQPDGLAAFIDARDRFLKPDGWLIPSSVQLLVSPIEAADFYSTTIDVWEQRVHGIDLSPLTNAGCERLQRREVHCGSHARATGPDRDDRSDARPVAACGWCRADEGDP